MNVLHLWKRILLDSRCWETELHPKHSDHLLFTVMILDARSAVQLLCSLEKFHSNLAMKGKSQEECFKLISVITSHNIRPKCDNFRLWQIALQQLSAWCCDDLIASFHCLADCTHLEGKLQGRLSKSIEQNVKTKRSTEDSSFKSPCYWRRIWPFCNSDSWLSEEMN